MSKIKIALNSAGVRELLKSPELEGVLQEHAGLALLVRHARAGGV